MERVDNNRWIDSTCDYHFSPAQNGCAFINSTRWSSAATAGARVEIGDRKLQACARPVSSPATSSCAVEQLLGYSRHRGFSSRYGTTITSPHTKI